MGSGLCSEQSNNLRSDKKVRDYLVGVMSLLMAEGSRNAALPWCCFSQGWKFVPEANGFRSWLFLVKKRVNNKQRSRARPQCGTLPEPCQYYCRNSLRTCWIYAEV